MSANMLSLHPNVQNDHNELLSSLVQVSQITTMIKQHNTFPPVEHIDTFQKMSSTNKETTTKKSNKRANTQNDGKARKKNKEHHEKHECETATAPKRLQVPRACSNCRRMHAGCGVERPCKRCIHNGLESSCVDVPRKKRSVKKGKNDSEEGDFIRAKSNVTSPSSSPTMQTTAVVRIKPEGDQHQLWQDTFHELYESTSGPSSTTSSLGSLSDIDLSAPLIFGSESDNSGFFSSFSHNDPIHSHDSIHIHSHDVIHHHDHDLHDMLPQEPHHDLPLPLAVNHHEEFEYNNLLLEITNLNENNKSLETKLQSLCEELVEMKKAVPTKRRTEGPLTQQAVMENPNVSVSMWMASFTDLVLVECDQRFVQIMGLPMDILKDNFPFSRVLENTPSDHNWPKKVKISTLSGSKEVLMTINMLTDGTTVKYFVVHILEL